MEENMMGNIVDGNTAVQQIHCQTVPYSARYRSGCADIFYKIFTMPPFHFSWLDRANVERYFTDLENAPRFLSYLLVNGDRPLGACLGQVDDYFMTAGYRVNEFFIDEEIQGLGMGTDFLRAVENNLRREGIEAIYLFAQKYSKAHAFYRRCGFLVNDETVHMVKLLG
ncbi:MAG: GNAT family N-acetyltransferase [Clostridiales bacterium]|jgi:GNAT superfamily N-acetyltransferase|nr:GNAT family N-acetyltransferase [Clostridiales bacterium]